MLLVPTRRIRALGCALALTGALATGCGGDEPLAKADLEQALLTTENLGPGWVEQPASESPSASPKAEQTTGADCTENLTDLEAQDKATATFAFTQGSLQVNSGVSSYDDEEAVAAKLSDDYELLRSEKCRTISSEAGGAALEAKVTADRTKSVGDVDGQLNVSTTGHYAAAGQQVPFHALLTVVRIGANLTTVHTVGSAEVKDLHQAYVEIAIGRLRAVTEGEEPAQTVAPAPGG